MRNAHVDSLDLRSLRFLAMLLATVSITRAGDAFGLSQPAASRLTARLRLALSDRLIVRGAQGYVLTARAESLKRELTAAQDALDVVFAAQRFDPATSTRVFHLGASEYAMLTVVPALVRELRLKAMGAGIDIVSATSRTLADLESGALDCSYWGLAPPGAPYHSRELFKEHFQGLAAANHPLAKKARVTLDDYLSFPHVAAVLGIPGPSPIEAALKKLMRQRKIAVTVPSFQSGVAALPGTDLVMSVPSRLVENLRKPGLAPFALPLEIPAFSYRLVWHERSATDAAAEWFRSAVARCIQ
jgi:DNA-binding transcriptional LysR family regulator